MAFVFKYGDYDFRPRPLISISSEPLKTPDGSGYGVIHTLTLEGDILLTETDQRESGIGGVFREIERLKSALSKDGCGLYIDCDDTDAKYQANGVPNFVISGNPRVVNYSFNPESDNYTSRAGYTITFEMDTLQSGTGADAFNCNSYPPYIESVEENWDVEIVDEQVPYTWDIGTGIRETFPYRAAVTHQVNVTARLHYTGCGLHNTPWEDARDYANRFLGFNGDFFTLSGILGLPGSGNDFSSYVSRNHMRQVSTDKTNGNISITETFLVLPSGGNIIASNAYEDFNVDMQQNEGVISVSVNGTIQGLHSTTWPQSSPTGNASGEVIWGSGGKYDSALAYWNTISGRLYDRASKSFNDVYSSDPCFSRPLNTRIRQRTVASNPLAGTISYGYTYDTIPSGCISGDCIISENITIDDQLLTDVFASQTVIGRAAGPILQDIGTTSSRTRTVSIELLTIPPTSCGSYAEIYAPVNTGAVNSFISGVTGDLAGFSQIFVSQNQQSWNFTAGRYTKTLAVTYNNCS